jgi:hypothetical protein
MATKFIMTRDVNGYNGFGLPFSDEKYSVTLATNTAQSLTVPSDAPLGGGQTGSVNKFIAIFSYTPGFEVWVASNAAASAPAGGSFAVTSSELLPTARYVSAGDILSFIAPYNNVNVSVTFYSLS